MKKKQRAHAAHKELDAAAVRKEETADPRLEKTVELRLEKTAELQSEKTAEETGVEREEETGVNTAPPADLRADDKATYITSAPCSTDTKDTSVWAMLDNHLNESTLDQSSDPALSRALWERDASDARSRRNGSRGDSGASGVLSLLGASPRFATVAGEHEAERNLARSVEKVERLPERLLCSGADPSPVRPAGTGAGEERGPLGRKKGVTFAAGGAPPRGGGVHGRAACRKLPYAATLPHAGGQIHGMMTTPLSTLSKSTESQANPMNESVIVSNDKASGEKRLFGASPSPLKGIGGDDEGDDTDTL
jgi:hypothetical protein